MYSLNYFFSLSLLHYSIHTYLLQILMSVVVTLMDVSMTVVTLLAVLSALATLDMP